MKSRVVDVEVPEEVAALAEKDRLLLAAVREVVRRELLEYVLTVLTLDRLTEDSRLTEEDVERIDRAVKRGIAKRWEEDL